MIADEQVSKDFFLSEFLVSDTAIRLHIDNTPSASILGALRNLLIPSMQGVRDLLKTPVLIKSAYRCPQLNAAVHGSQNSQHMDGAACDFISPKFGLPSAVAHFLVDRIELVRPDQIILEAGAWIHISFAAHPRLEVLTAHFTSQGVSYTEGIA